LDDIIKSGEKNLSSGSVPTEVFPYSNGSTQVPTEGFSYWKKHPIVGWREYKFKQEVIKPNINSTADIGTTAKQGTTALS
jgi:hypothetical protein